MIAVLCVQLPSGHASSHGHTTVLAIEASVRQARVCGTVCHRTCDKTWTSRVSSINWKHFCLWIRQPRRIVTVAIVRHRNTLTYLLIYLELLLHGGVDWFRRIILFVAGDTFITGRMTFWRRDVIRPDTFCFTGDNIWGGILSWVTPAAGTRYTTLNKVFRLFAYTM